MADPKYQSLPYVAVDQPDVYESADLPESEQALENTTDVDEVVERFAVDPKDAFNRFNKAAIDSSSSNFSEEAIPGRAGYSVRYEIISSDEKAEESLTQKIQRLKQELKEIEELSKLELSREVNPTTIISEVESLKKQIDAFSNSSSAYVGSLDSNDVAYGQLLSQLKISSSGKGDTKGKTQTVKSLKGESESDPNQAMFELHYSPDVAMVAKEANIDARITKLEQMLGQGEAGSSEPVLDMLSNISSKVHLLEEDNLDKLSARLQILLQTLDKVKESSSSTEARELEKVNELYELVKKWDTCVDSLPLIVDRLYTLQELHQQAMEFSASLKALESAQNELGQNIGGHSQLLTEVQKTFAVNIDAIKSNIDVLGNRIDALSKR